MDLHVFLIAVGGLLLVGMVTDEIGRRMRLPRVTLLILFGLAAGPAGFDVLPRAFQDWYAFIASAALTMVAFLLGGRLSLAALRKHGKTILVVSLAVVVLTAVFVGIGLVAIGTPAMLALLLAGIATATAPAATQDVFILEGPVLRQRYQLSAVYKFAERAVETCIIERVSGIADDDRAMSATRNLFKFFHQIRMNEKRGNAIVLSQPVPRSLSRCKELALGDDKAEPRKAL